jgi:hypothetical protein
MAAAVALAVTAMTGFGLHAAGAATTDQSSNRPFAYAGFASTGGIFYQVDTEHGLEAFKEPFYARAPDGQSKFTGTGDFARSSVIYPGATFNVPSALTCQIPGAFPPGAFPGPIATIMCGLPRNPLSVSADDSSPDAAVTGAPALGTATAHADQDHAKTDATFANLDIGSLTGSQQNTLAGLVRTIGTALGNATVSNLVPPSTGPVAVVHVAGLESHTSQAFTNGGAKLTTVANSALSGVDVLGGLIHIGSVAVASSALADGQNSPSRTNKIDVKDVLVAGQPATIGPDGITIGSSTIGKGLADSLTNTLNGALQAMGIEIHLMGTSPVSVTDGSACQSGESDGVLIKSRVDLSNAPSSIFPTLPGLGRPFGPDVYFAHFVLGGACADASALLNPDTGLGGDLGGVIGAAGTGGLTGGEASATGLTGTNSGLGLGSNTGPVLAHPKSPRSSGRGSRTTQGGFLEADLRGLVANRVKLAYLAFTLAFLAIFLGYRPFLPSRLPGGP